ncbi:cytochrome P450 [Penicillium longicatenatum]|nr:cytochrome P450 [Penicillium longicatenatum]
MEVYLQAINQKFDAMIPPWILDLQLFNPISILGFIAFFSLANVILSKRQNPSSLPVLNARKWHEFGYSNRIHRFNTDPTGLIKSGFDKCKDAFFLFTDSQFLMILSPKYVEAIQNDHRLDLRESSKVDFHGGVPGFEPITAAGGSVGTDIIKKRLSRSLVNLVAPLSSEADHAIQQRWSDPLEWHESPINHINKIVAQVSTRAFLRDDICRDPAWVELAAQYTNDVFEASHYLREWPKFLRYAASWFLPYCRNLRKQMREAEDTLQPTIAKLKSYRESSTSSTEFSKANAPEPSSVDWLMEIAHRFHPSEFTKFQLGLFVASIDTTSDQLIKLLGDLSDESNLVDEIRAEVIDVIGKEGLNKGSLAQLQLMDSAMKESQRMAPVGCILVSRYATEEVILPDGLIIPRGTSCAVPTTHMMESSTWPDAEKFDGYRYLTMRRASKTPAVANFVTPSTNHLGFGHGKQACPGRFFAECVIKILLCHILLKYDFRVGKPEEGRSVRRGRFIISHPTLKIELKRRKEEISL